MARGRGWAWLRRHDLSVFFLTVFALTWVVWIPRAAGVPMGVLGDLWTWAPAVAAVSSAALSQGRAGVRDLGRRLVLWRVGWIWYLLVLLGPLIFSVLVAAVDVLLGGSWTAARPSALALSLPAIALTLAALTLTDGLGEELAWRGYALPRLLVRHRMLAASLILGVVWWLWHLPLVWTVGAAIEGEPVWLLLVDLLAKSLLFTIVFVHTRGSVLIAILLHASTNLFAVSPAPGTDGDLTLPLIALALKWLLAAVTFAAWYRSTGASWRRSEVS